MKLLSHLLLLALSAALLAAPGTAQEGRARELGADDLKSEIDRSLRWLRGQQDLETGSYGSPLATAWAVAAFVDGPRAYRLGDGPFLDKALTYLEGTVGENHLVGGDAEELEATAALLLALRSLEGERVRTLEAELMEGLRLARESWPWPKYEQEFASAEIGRLVAREFLGSRSDDGTWDGPRGRVTETAQLLWELSRAWRALKPSSSGGPTTAPTELPAFTPADRAVAQQALVRGAAFLAQAADGGRWGIGDRVEPGITAMVLGALLSVPGPLPERAAKELDAGLDWLRSLQKPDGSIHDGQLANYVTSAAVLAFVRAGREEDREAVEKARAFLVKLQADEDDGYAESDRYYGGVGYGGDERPDLSNLQMALEAMRASGLEQDDPAFAKALTFLQRVQNRSESNDLVLETEAGVIASGDDGGAGYAPGESKAGLVELPDGTKVPRSYGSMTYALLKGYLFAGLDKDDPRVEAAWKWLMSHYTLDVNPGFEASSDPAAAYQGLYYYFYTMARALDLYGVERIEDSGGTEHAWRSELTGRLVALQRQDGSWVNDNSPRWWEGNPVLATAYAMLSLDSAMPPE